MMETPTTAETDEALRKQNFLQDVDGEDFRNFYLQGDSVVSSLVPLGWSAEEMEFACDIQKATEGGEQAFYADHAPLIRLLNFISERIFNTVPVNDIEQDALVFHSTRKFEVMNTFGEQNCTPNIVAIWEKSRSRAFPTVNHSLDHLTPTTWSAFAAIGEAEISQFKTESVKYQLSNYLQTHLQCHPELNAVLGFTATPTEYALFYHDADVIQRAGFGWDQITPLYAFVGKLYTRPFQDTSMEITNAEGPSPVWVTRIGSELYTSQSPQSLAGPGQRRYTTKAGSPSNSEVVFLKDVWRDEERLLSDVSLFEQAREGNPLPGLMRVDNHGFVHDTNGGRVRTTSYQPQSKDGRYKMRLMTTEIGGPLERVTSLRQLLCVVYDACAVQRNLYRKCRILHRDISDTNIMVAPNTDEYRKRCATGFAQVKFINQVLAKETKCDPNPACLVIDLGNSADLKVPRNKATLGERTGTPRFIARSVAAGRLLRKGDFFPSPDINLPSTEIGEVDYSRFMHTTEYQHITGDPTESDLQFTHRLFHEAESTLWVLIWLLCRSTKDISTRKERPLFDFCLFFHTMAAHYPVKDFDSRDKLCQRDEEYWEDVLHPDFASLSGMLNKMFSYIRPEWAHRPELNPEHVHEALMRILLAEIVRIDDNDADLPIVIGGRKIPPPTPHRFLSTSPILPHISLPCSLEPQHNNPDELPQPGHDLQQPAPEPEADSGYDSYELKEATNRPIIGT